MYIEIFNYVFINIKKKTIFYNINLSLFLSLLYISLFYDCNCLLIVSLLFVSFIHRYLIKCIQEPHSRTRSRDYPRLV